MNELKVDSVVHSFGERRILSDVFLSVQTGEIVGLLGRNGCGKLTLLKIIFGSLKANHGVIHMNGNFQKKMYKKKLVAYLPQHDFLPKDLSVKKAFSVYVENTGVRERIMQHEMFHAIHNSRIRTLSGGMLRFLEIILILHINRPFLLLDEPFTGLSPLYRELVHEYLADIQAEKGIMITDHDYRNVIDISDRLILMKNGRTIPLGNHEELIDYSYVPEGKTL